MTTPWENERLKAMLPNHATLMRACLKRGLRQEWYAFEVSTSAGEGIHALNAIKEAIPDDEAVTKAADALIDEKREWAGMKPKGKR